ncbi:hypothetical protein LCGC14_1588390, partial [marine sediment metagenome]
FNITIDEYDALSQRQGGVCAICRSKETMKNKYGLKRLAVDHNHLTGKIRGLLCGRCNQALGLFASDEEGVGRLLSAVEYMRRNNV